MWCYKPQWKYIADKIIWLQAFCNACHRLLCHSYVKVLAAWGGKKLKTPACFFEASCKLKSPAVRYVKMCYFIGVKF